jgi:hypothetical protein
MRTLDGSPLRPSYAVVSQRYALAGSPLAYSPRIADRSGYAAWKVSQPLRMVSEVSGVDAVGDIVPGAVGQVDAYGCANGAFRLTLLAKQPGVVRIALDGREIRHRSFPGPTEWDVTIPVSKGPQRCRLTVQGTGLVGTTRLEFDPAP